MKRRRWLGSVVLLLILAGTAIALAAWKRDALAAADAAAAAQPEPVETVTVAPAVARDHLRTTTSIGTVLALRSITLRNELPGTVREVALEPGSIVEEGALLVALDVAVEEAELKAQEAQAALAESMLGRMQSATVSRAVSETEVDRALAERDVALAQIARTRAIIERKTLRAPFRARVGMADVHPGQYLAEGAELTTLQGVDDAIHVDFTVPQEAAAGLRTGGTVQVIVAAGAPPVTASIVAIDALVDPATRNALVRARVERATAASGADDAASAHDAARAGAGPGLPAPGASVRVLVPVGGPSAVVVVPVSALRKSPAGDHVFVIGPGADGQTRAQLRPVIGGTMLGDEVVVHAGLEPGEQVASSGSFKLREGALVAIVPDATASADAGAPQAVAPEGGAAEGGEP